MPWCYGAVFLNIEMARAHEIFHLQYTRIRSTCIVNQKTTRSGFVSVAGKIFYCQPVLSYIEV